MLGRVLLDGSLLRHRSREACVLAHKCRYAAGSWPSRWLGGFVHLLGDLCSTFGVSPRVLSVRYELKLVSLHLGAAVDRYPARKSYDKASRSILPARKISRKQALNVVETTSRRPRVATGTASEFVVVSPTGNRDVLIFEFKGSPGKHKALTKHSTAPHRIILSAHRRPDTFSTGCAATKLLA